MFVIPAKEKACQELGYKNFIHGEGLNYCVDLEGNLYTVDWGFNKFPNDIWVKRINVH